MADAMQMNAMYDLIGDVYEQADELMQLLAALAHL
jgi:hypothetical protein